MHFFDISTPKNAPELKCFVHFDLEICFAPQRRALFPHLNFQKWSEREVFLAFSLANVLRATTACVHFFDISTPKSAPELRCFVHFDLEMCFAPQWRALFPHLNFQKWSEREVFLAFSLANVLRATTACVHFFDISTPKSAPELRCFVHFDLEMCFAPQWRALFPHLNFQKWSQLPMEPQIVGKPQCFATFLPFRAPTSSFF